MRFDFLEVWYGIELGQVTLVGTSRVTGRRIQQSAKGAVPEPSGRIRVSPSQGTYQVDGETLHHYLEETILEVVELPPERFLRSPPS